MRFTSRARARARVYRVRAAIREQGAFFEVHDGRERGIGRESRLPSARIVAARAKAARM